MSSRSLQMCRWPFAVIGLLAMNVEAAQLDVISGFYDTETDSIDAFEVVNTVVGAGIFYQAGYFGQNTIVANVEAGHVWSGHEVFDRSGFGMSDSPVLMFNGTRDPVTAPHLGDVDYHATMVGHVLAGTGDDGEGNLGVVGAGMAPLAALWSGAIATSFDRTEEGVGSFEISRESFLAPYVAFFEGDLGSTPDVINSSWGFTDPAGTADETRILDALSAQNPTVTFVRSAGNSGPTAAPGGPGSGYNGITVGSLGGAQLLTPSTFSSGAAGDFYNPQTGETITGVRAVVDIAAPGEDLFLAAYLGESGGLADILGEPDPPTGLYFVNAAGTSFASPVVAGGIALLKDVSHGGVYPGVDSDAARDTRVIQSVIQAGAHETIGWDNGQHLEGDVIVTTQGLDYTTGAGRLDLETAAAIYLGGTTDVAGVGGGVVDPLGWDIGLVGLGSTNDYFFDLAFASAVNLTVSLNWFVNSTYDSIGDVLSWGSFADLNLSLWLVSGGVFATEVARSASLYGNSEFLRLLLEPGSYGLRVSYDENVYDLTGLLGSETYGLAWLTTAAVPEPWEWSVAIAVLLLGMAVVRHRRPAG